MRVVFAHTSDVKSIARNIISHRPEGTELDDLGQRVARRIAKKTNRYTKRIEISATSMQILQNAVRLLIIEGKVFCPPAENGKSIFFPGPAPSRIPSLAASAAKAVAVVPTVAPEVANGSKATGGKGIVLTEIDGRLFLELDRENAWNVISYVLASK